ncbi:MAG TPA: hypothetical protein VM925_32235 [Labilithrix sp.]|nr:hypothetical protein [Labilithrix sp.]
MKTVPIGIVLTTCLAIACSVTTSDDVEAQRERLAAQGPTAKVDLNAYGFATDPPTMALADTFYGYDLRTAIGKCATDRVEWTLAQAPSGARLVLPRSRVELAQGETRSHETDGDDREAARVLWDLGGVVPGSYPFSVRWRAWIDCGIFDGGKWGPEVTQSWTLELRKNGWYSGDLHVHTKHSERDDDAGSVFDYYRRIRNETSDDAGRRFANRSTESLRGRLHWLVFSDHTNNEREECGRHFATWCSPKDDVFHATGRDVARHFTEHSGGDVLLVVGSEISNRFGGHFGFLPRNPFPGHVAYAPGYSQNPTFYDYDSGFGSGVFRERWVDDETTNQQELDLGHAMNGLMILNHEDSFPGHWVKYDWSSLDFDGIEVWNGANRHDEWDDSAYNGGLDLNRVSKGNKLELDIPERPIHRSYIGMLKRGRWPLALVGGSDAHDHAEVICGGLACDPTNAELGVPTTTVWADSFVWTNGKTGIEDGIAAGRAVVHDASNFIDLRITYEGHEYMIGDTIEGYEPGTPLAVRAFGRTAAFIDGDNRVLTILGTNGEESDAAVDVLYDSEDETHFVKKLKGKDHMRYIRPESNFDRQWQSTIDGRRLGAKKTFFVWAQFIPWHHPAYAFGNGRDMAETGVIRVLAK